MATTTETNLANLLTAATATAQGARTDLANATTAEAAAKQAWHDAEGTRIKTAALAEATKAVVEAATIANGMSTVKASSYREIAWIVGGILAVAILVGGIVVWDNHKISTLEFQSPVHMKMVPAPSK